MKLPNIILATRYIIYLGKGELDFGGEFDTI
jgi:hypothetical protein